MKRADFLRLAGIASMAPLLPTAIIAKKPDAGVVFMVTTETGKVVHKEILPDGTTFVNLPSTCQPGVTYRLTITHN